MESKEYRAAIEAYKKAEVEVQTAGWYKMLAFLALEEYGKAKDLLNRLK